jgi:hypothetical protein
MATGAHVLAGRLLVDEPSELPEETVLDATKRC